MALSPPVRNNKIVKVIEERTLKKSKLLLQLKKPVQLELGFFKIHDKHRDCRVD